MEEFCFKAVLFRRSADTELHVGLVTVTGVYFQGDLVFLMGSDVRILFNLYICVLVTLSFLKKKKKTQVMCNISPYVSCLNIVTMGQLLGWLEFLKNGFLSFGITLSLLMFSFLTPCE